MQFLTLTNQYTDQAKQLWNSHFDDGTPGFCDFLFSSVEYENIYIATENEKVISLLLAATQLEYKNSKGFYLYSACTHAEYQNRGYMSRLVDFALKDQQKKGNSFCVVQPATQQLFEFWNKQGFRNIVSQRRCDIEIKRNIWTKRSFDIVTASRFPAVRNKHCEENIVHYTKKSYENYTQYMYTTGGSTAESDNAYAVYFIENGKLYVKEIFALTTVHAMQLLQAIRERTGYETATVSLSDNSTLFLGEGKKEKVYAVYGIDDEVYINLMFE